jgi:hypothetical protein
MTTNPLQLSAEKIIEPGAWRWIGQRLEGLSSLDVPIGGSSIKSIARHTGGRAYRIGSIKPSNAFVIERPPLRLLYVRPAYGGYHYAARKVFSKADWPIDYDHVLGRKIAMQLGFSYVLLIRLSPRINRSHGPFEKKAALVTGLNLHKLCFADRRIMNKWIGRPSKLFGRQALLDPYSLNSKKKFGSDVKQAGRWGYAMGVDDAAAPNSNLFPL